MKTNSLSRLLSLLLAAGLPAAACSPGEKDSSVSVPGASGEGQGGGEAPGGPGGDATTSCVYVKRSTMYCPGAGPTDFGGEPEEKCVENSACGFEDEEFLSAGCKVKVTYLAQRVLEGSCHAYELERYKAEDRETPGSYTCRLTPGDDACSACAERSCCEELKGCNVPDACVEFAKCESYCLSTGPAESEPVTECLVACAARRRFWEMGHQIHGSPEKYYETRNVAQTCVREKCRAECVATPPICNRVGVEGCVFEPGDPLSLRLERAPCRRRTTSDSQGRLNGRAMSALSRRVWCATCLGHRPAHGARSFGDRASS